MIQEYGIKNYFFMGRNAHNFTVIIILLGYNMIHSPKSLITSSIVIGVVVFSSFFYRFFRVREEELSPFMDKNLEREESAKELAQKINKEA